MSDEEEREHDHYIEFLENTVDRYRQIIINLERTIAEWEIGKRERKKGA